MSGVTVKWYGPKAKAAVKRGAAEGLKDAADHLLAASQPLVPVAPVGGGWLRDSGKAEVDAGALRAAVSYTTGPPSRSKTEGRTGTPASLAVTVHEDMSASHSSGQSKYLEQPYNSEKGTLLDMVATAIRRKIK